MDRLRTSTPENPQFKIQNELMNFAIAALEQGVEQQQRALHDPLTGLYNRRALEIQFDELIQSDPINRRSDPQGEQAFKPHSLITLDIDNFRTFNDEHGHKGGDQALRHFAQRLRKGAFRLSEGADEFVMLLPHTTEEEAADIAAKILERENAAGLEASVGVSEINALESLDDNMHRADEAMYVAKENGRNQVVRHSRIERSDQPVSV